MCIYNVIRYIFWKPDVCFSAVLLNSISNKLRQFVTLMKRSYNSNICPQWPHATKHTESEATSLPVDKCLLSPQYISSYRPIPEFRFRKKTLQGFFLRKLTVFIQMKRKVNEHLYYKTSSLLKEPFV